MFKKSNVDTGTDTGPRSEEESYIREVIMHCNKASQNYILKCNKNYDFV